MFAYSGHTPENKKFYKYVFICNVKMVKYKPPYKGKAYKPPSEGENYKPFEFEDILNKVSEKYSGLEAKTLRPVD
jgi:hypothetical protein